MKTSDNLIKIAEFSKYMATLGYENLYGQKYLKGGFICEIEKEKPCYFVTNGELLIASVKRPVGFVVSKEKNLPVYLDLVKIINSTFSLAQTEGKTISADKIKELKEKVRLNKDLAKSVIKISSSYYSLRNLSILFDCLPLESKFIHVYNPKYKVEGIFCSDFYSLISSQKINDDTIIIGEL